MRFRRTFLILLILNAFLIGLRAASAHSPSVYYPTVYKAGHHDGLTPKWWFTPNFPGGAFKTKVKNAFSTWNNASAPLNFSFQGTKSSGYTPYQTLCTDWPYNGVFHNDTPFIGETLRCVHSATATIHGFSLIMENRSDCGATTCKWDVEGGTNSLQGAATHEMGHVTGFSGHFPAASESTGICWWDTTFHTMCNGVYPVPDRIETLEAHDLHTFNDSY